MVEKSRLPGAVQAQGGGAVNGEGEGNAGEFMQLKGTVGEVGSAVCTKCIRIVVVFEDEEVIEGSLRGTETTGAADEGEWRMLVFPEVNPVLTKSFEQGQQGLTGRKNSFDRQRIDEKTDGVF